MGPSGNDSGSGFYGDTTVYVWGLCGEAEG